eukprot:SAG22_NODE_657_length_8082_cov_7.277590_4_plen_171_part_00
MRTCDRQTDRQTGRQADDKERHCLRQHNSCGSTREGRQCLPTHHPAERDGVGRGRALALPAGQPALAVGRQQHLRLAGLEQRPPLVRLGRHLGLELAEAAQRRDLLHAGLLALVEQPGRHPDVVLRRERALKEHAELLGVDVLAAGLELDLAEPEGQDQLVGREQPADDL